MERSTLEIREYRGTAIESIMFLPWTVLTNYVFYNSFNLFRPKILL